MDAQHCESVSIVAEVCLESVRLRRPKFGLAQDELNVMLQSSFWKPMRAFCFFLYWAVLAALIAGSVLIVLFGIGVIG